VNANYRFVSEFNKMKTRANSLGRALSRQRETTLAQNTTLELMHRALIISETSREEAMVTAREAVDLVKKVSGALDAMVDNVRILANRVR